MAKRYSDTPLISTSALAKKLDLPAKVLFESLQDKGWIERINNNWKLTGKGQFEGGDYVFSKKYGEYIGWPESVLEHVIFSELFNRPLRTRVIGRELNISAHRFNALLAELGWQKKFHRGWVLTTMGRLLDGEEQEDEESGVPYTLWPRTILDNPRLQTALAAIQTTTEKRLSESRDDSNQQTLDFNTPETPISLKGLDGHQLDHMEDLILDNWLYLMDVPHAYQRELPDPSLGSCDFYLPAAHLYIECWHAKDVGADLSNKLARLEYYQTQKLAYFEVSADDLLKLDTVLPKLLLKYGITVF